MSVRLQVRLCSMDGRLQTPRCAYLATLGRLAHLYRLLLAHRIYHRLCRPGILRLDSYGWSLPRTVRLVPALWCALAKRQLGGKGREESSMVDQRRMGRVCYRRWFLFADCRNVRVDRRDDQCVQGRRDQAVYLCG